MKKATLILLAISLLAACKKKDKSTPASYTTMVKTVKVVYEDGNVVTVYSYTYYSDGRVRTETEDASYDPYDLIYPLTYTYAADKVTMTSANGARVYYLNSEGLADSVVETDEYGAERAYVYTMKYDADGYCIERRLYSPVRSRYEYIIVNGNTTVERYFDEDDSLVQERPFTYDMDHANTLDPVNFGKPFLGKFSKNAMISGRGGALHFDGLGRIDRIDNTGSSPYMVEQYTLYEYY